MSRFNSLMSEIDPVISDLELKDGRVMVKEDVNLYQAIEKLISLKKAENDILSLYDKVNELIIEYAKMNFSANIERETELEFLLPIERGLAMMADELKQNAVPVNYLDDTLDMIQEITLITDHNGIVKHINNKIKGLGYGKTEMLNARVWKLFENSDFRFEIGHLGKIEEIADKECNLKTKSNKKIQAILNIKKTQGLFDSMDGLIFTIKI